MVVAETAGVQNRLKQLDYRVLEFLSYLDNNHDALIDYGRRYREVKAISTAMAESAVNQVVNARMCKRQQMRCAVINGDLAARLRRWPAQPADKTTAEELLTMAGLNPTVLSAPPSMRRHARCRRCVSAAHVWHELRAQGFSGSRGAVRNAMARARAAAREDHVPRSGASGFARPSPRQAYGRFAFLYARGPDQRVASMPARSMSGHAGLSSLSDAREAATNPKYRDMAAAAPSASRARRHANTCQRNGVRAGR